MNESGAETTAARTIRAATRGAERVRAEDCLQLLARAVQQLHTYPASSPLCQQAVDACHRALSIVDQREAIEFRVTPSELMLDEAAVGRGTIIETELARRLHAAGVAQVTIQRAASARELARFCGDLLACTLRGQRGPRLSEMLAEHGVGRIALGSTSRPEVLDVAAPLPPVAAAIEEQRTRRSELLAQGAPVNHLYPPDKGWIRVDPTVRYPTVSLVDLALMVDDPKAFASMLVSLTDDADGNLSSTDALTQKYTDVATIFSALDPQIARGMFSRLANAVLDLDPARRQRLLRRSILPGLLDGRVEGEILKDFPDVDLADSLCLLLDLETAAPEVVTSALSRLGLPAEREDAMLPLIRARLQTRGAAQPARGDTQSRSLTAVDASQAKTFAEFTAFDLALDQPALDTLVTIRDTIAAADVRHQQITCLWNVVRLQANPEVVQRFMNRAAQAMEPLDTEGSVPAFTFWLARFGELATSLRDSRPDVSEAIAATLGHFCSMERALRLIELSAQGPDGRSTTDTIILALGARLGPGLAAAAAGRSGDGRDQAARGAQQLLCDHARLFAPAVVEALVTADTASARGLVRVLGFAGPGYEPAIAAHLDSPDEQMVREALRSLARLATAEAASCVCVAIDQKNNWVATAAAETLWHFPPGEARRQVIDLLSRREFVVRQPHVAARLLERAAQSGTEGLEPILATLEPLRYRLWSPVLARVGRRARILRRP